jgi:hypothetical protein
MSWLATLFNMTQPTCNFLLRAEGPQIECGEPATQSRRTRGGGIFYYCDIHAEQALRDTKRQGKTLILSRVEPG